MRKFWRWRSVRRGNHHHITRICFPVAGMPDIVPESGLTASLLGRTSLWLLTAARWSYFCVFFRTSKMWCPPCGMFLAEYRATSRFLPQVATVLINRELDEANSRSRRLLCKQLMSFLFFFVEPQM